MGYKPCGVTYENRTTNISLPGGGYGSFADGPLPDFYEGPAYLGWANKTRDLWTTKTTGGRLTDGVFAIDIMSFMWYFAGFSWV